MIEVVFKEPGDTSCTYKKRTEIIVEDDVTVNDMGDIFMGIMNALGFSESQIEKVLGDGVIL